MRVFNYLKYSLKIAGKSERSREYEKAFEKQIYKHSLLRFSGMAFCLLLVNSISLIAYSINYALNGKFIWLHIILHLCAILLFLCLFFAFSKQDLKKQKENKLFWKVSDLWMALLYTLMEFALFATGPQDVGALIRMFMIPFILGNLLATRRKLATTLIVLVFTCSVIYVNFFSRYAETKWFLVVLINIFIVCLFGAIINLITINFGIFHQFTGEENERKTKRELENMNKKLEIMAHTDKLTGVSNRHVLEEILELAMESRKDKPEEIAVVMIDVDCFKSYNDFYGHTAGDEGLVCVARAIESSLPNANYIVARYGGEEFIVVAFGRPRQEVCSFAEKTRKVVEALRLENPKSTAGFYLTISCGVSFGNTQKVAMQTVIHAADECLYRAKKEGRNIIVYKKNNDDVFYNVQDIALKPEAKKTKAERTNKISQVRQFIGNAGLDSIFVFSSKYEELHFSYGACEMLGVPKILKAETAHDVIERAPVSSEDKETICNEIDNAIKHHSETLTAEIGILHKSGKKIWVALQMRFLYDQNGKVDVITGTLYQVERIISQFQKMRNPWFSDVVTGLPGRQQFRADMYKWISEDRAGHVVLFDIAKFKNINGIYGHKIGDGVLRKAAERMRANLLENIAIYHNSVDQFLLALPDTSKTFAKEIVLQVLSLFANKEVVVDGILVKISFHAGLLAFEETNEGIDDLLLNLDIALQKSKQKQSPNYCLFKAQDKEEYLYRIKLEKELNEAVEKDFDRFALHYQPLFTMQNVECVGAEALLRWTDAHGEFVSPLTVVAALERSDLIFDIGVWVLEEACRQCAKWIEQGASDDFFVHVNLSPKQVNHENFAQDIFNLIIKYGLSPKNLILELTESSFMADTALATDILTKLRGHGVRISVDDFGTGYSSLSYLRDIPADQIKIDKSFLDDVEFDESARRIFSSISSLIKSMGFEVVVEGVESEAQMLFLKNSDIDILQGFLLGHPIPANVFECNWFAQSDLYKKNELD